jgi:hypothetical protein
MSKSANLQTCSFAHLQICFPARRLSLGGEDFPTFCTPSGEDLSTVPIGHPFPKTEFVFSFSTMRLIGSFHNSFLLSSDDL